MSCRETGNIFWYIKDLIIFPKRGGFKWCLKSIGRCLRNPYMWHDTFGKYWNRIIRCPIFGHEITHLKESCLHDYPVKYCFKCEREICKKEAEGDKS